MYVKFSFLETEVKIPGCWGGLIVNVVGTPSIVVDLPKDVSANTYIVNKPCPESEVDDLIIAAKAERDAKAVDSKQSQTSDYSFAEKIRQSIKNEQYLLNQYIKAMNNKELNVESGGYVGKFNSSNEDNVLIVKDYYYDCGSVSKKDVERSLNILTLLFNNFNASECSSGKGIVIVATGLYPKFNPILEVFDKTISCVNAALPEHCGTILATIGLNRIRERVRPRGIIQESQDETSFTAPIPPVRRAN
ncbi:hypothetical protein [Legionella quateirensis]|uniref:Uncharacterized protein n=1 Tax=Legionella quateirensis TaxID=45072 RepID=A0A378KU77_9GAMM|nr:hypothetical protein [Legionella quateirensis]KTD54758.1 hypothetical protein Lqua_0265 [Legionella quateirensis]STY16938.1 Uncharacterised protein [Legionella quateirensis]